MAASTSETVGVVGLGLMGAAMSERFIGARLTVVGYDRVPEKVAALAAIGGEAAQDAAEVAARCDRIVYAVLTTAQVEESLREIDNALRPGSLVIDTTTGSPPGVARLAQALRERGAAYVDATVAGSSEELRRGEALVMAGGDPDAFRRCEDLFACFARKAVHLGPAGSGASMKLVVNLALGLNRAVLGEALAFAEALGIDPAKALEIMRDSPAYSRAMEVKGEKMLARDYRPQARLSQHLKDVRLILDMAEKRGARVPLSRLHAGLLEILAEAGLGDFDNSAIVEAFRRDPGRGQ